MVRPRGAPGPPARQLIIATTMTLYWQEDLSEQHCEVPTDILDILFTLDGKRLPVDHAHALMRAIAGVLPWFEEEPGLGIHSIHVAGSQNGWERPEHGTHSHILLSRRTKLTIRAPRDRVESLIAALSGVTLDVNGCPLTLGAAKTRLLSKETTLFSRYLVSLPGESEGDFLTRAAAELAALDIRLRKALCGKSLTLAIPDGVLETRSLLLADLAPEESIRLQRHGLGPYRAMGCGLFIPHKGIESVRKGG